MSRFASDLLMKRGMSQKMYRNTRWLIGGFISLHGIYRIILISDYLDFVTANFTGMIPSETLLVVVSSLFPFIEFFVGILIIFKIIIKNAVKVGLVIFLIMTVFILQANLWEQMICHSFVIIGLILLYEEVKEIRSSNTII